ncbi:MAG: phage Gp37/Gp68 family protein [Leptospiraceae bacterium]|nr:phage Gp37/Gp68 family protein [Leptospiraceae bacterium]
MSKSKIEWTERTWNPLTGCTRISPGCKNCYAERMAKRLKAMGIKRYKNGFDLTLHNDVLIEPLKRKTPTTYFVNSMSDLLHKNVPLEFIKEVFDIMNRAHWHTFQVLTKRSERLKELGSLHWTKNIWMGVSVENQDYLYRILDLLNTPAKTKFISFEPLLGEINFVKFSNSLDKENNPWRSVPILTGIDWAIVGGESGTNERPLNIDWVRKIRDTCLNSNIKFFFKQWGGFNKKITGNVLDGKVYQEIPGQIQKEKIIHLSNRRRFYEFLETKGIKYSPMDARHSDIETKNWIYRYEKLTNKKAEDNEYKEFIEYLNNEEQKLYKNFVNECEDLKYGKDFHFEGEY